MECCETKNNKGCCKDMDKSGFFNKQKPSKKLKGAKRK